jgi:hypothetical protein
MLCGPQFKGEKAYVGHKTTRKALKMVKFFSKFVTLSIFEMFAGRTNASGGPHAACVLETLEVGQ